ncbi:hypothetical protein T05_5972 [Trichinella murrelli]|uniref:Uncharacterized protein n=1 Tax=Trichinella murrelli TaxID=144512 RepID=A0A0V0TNN6_9BILA|nr:hypothetical protein T05_5972 [Trichinella murrelli]
MNFRSYASFRFLLPLLKSHYVQCLLQYLGKYAFMQRFWKIPMQTKRYLLNKLPLKFACAYTNTQESSETDTLQKQRQYA